MDDIIPATLTWESLQTQIASFLGLGLVLGAIGLTVAMRMGPRVIAAIMRVFRSG